MATLTLEEGMETDAFSASWALRMRVSMSAMGSLIAISESPDYQLALTTPGISPLKASSRILLRHRPNLRKTPRGRPVSWQRLRRRDGLELRGMAWIFRRAS